MKILAMVLAHIVFTKIVTHPVLKKNKRIARKQKIWPREGQHLYYQTIDEAEPSEEQSFIEPESQPTELAKEPISSFPYVSEKKKKMIEIPLAEKPDETNIQDDDSDFSLGSPNRKQIKNLISNYSRQDTLEDTPSSLDREFNLDSFDKARDFMLDSHKKHRKSHKRH